MNLEVEIEQENVEKEKKSGVNKYLAAVIAAALIWSTSFVATKTAYTTFPPLTLGAARFIIASFFLGIILIIKKEFIKPPAKDLVLISISGVLGITIYFAMENIGVKLTTASNAALIVASYPAMTALFELVFYKTRISWTKFLGIAIAIAGVYILICNNQEQGGAQQFTGNLILIGTGIVWALYNFTTRKVVKSYPMITISFYQTVAGTIAFIPLALTEKESWQMPTLQSFLILFYLGILCSVIAFVLYNYGLRKLSSSSAVALMNLVPVFGVIFSISLLHEVIHINQIVGGAIVLIGVALSVGQWSK